MAPGTLLVRPVKRVSSRGMQDLALPCRHPRNSQLQFAAAGGRFAADLDCQNGVPDPLDRHCRLALWAVLAPIYRRVEQF